MKRQETANLNTARPSLAYIDGGLAAFLVQAAIAGFLGILWTMKGYWYRIKAFFGSENSAQPDQDGNPR
jgi:hypothetical protein